MARIFNIDLVLFQMRQRLSQDRHVREMKRHVLECFRVRFSFEERDGDVLVANRDPVFEFKFFAQPQYALKPARTFLWIAHGQTEMADDAEREWYFHSQNKSWE